MLPPRHCAVSVLAIVTMLCSPVFAAEPAAPAAAAQAGDAECQLLSEVLPARLGQFVQRFGADRPVQELSATDLQNLNAADPDPAVMVDILRPETYIEVNGPVVLDAAQEVVPPGRQAKAKEPRTLLIAGTIVFLDDGTVIDPGEEIVLGDVVTRGLVLNAGDTAVLVERERGEMHRSQPIFAGGAVGVKCDPCSVECGDGYFACCLHDKSGCPLCKCRQTGADDSKCESGGEGAVSCSLGKE